MTAGTSIVIRPTRAQSSASISPRKPHCCDPPGQLADTATVAASGSRRSLMTCTSSVRARPAAHRLRQRVADDDHRTAGLDDRRPRRLRPAVVIEHRRRDHRHRIGEPGEAEPAGRAILEPAQGLDLAAQQLGLVALRRPPPRSERGMLLGRMAGPHHLGFEAVVLGEVVPVQRRPRRGVDEGGGALRRRLGAELADEAHEAGQGAGPLVELAHLAAVPAEPEVAVGPVELGEVGEHPAVGDRRSGRVGLLERPLDPAIEHRLVPRRKLLADEPAQPRARRVTVELWGIGDRLVVGAPLDDRRVMAERRHRLACLVNCFVADVAPIAPLQWEVLEEDHTELVGGGVQVLGGDVRLDAQRVESGVDGTLDVGADQHGAGVGQTGSGRDEVGALEEQPLAVDRELPVGERHFAEPGAPGGLVADLAVDHHLDAQLGQRLPAERCAATRGVVTRCRGTTRCRCCGPPRCARSRRPPRRRQRS